MARLPLFLVFWAGFLCIKIPTVIAGFLVVPLLYPYRSRDIGDLPWWTVPWANPEDWTGGPKGVRGHSLPRWWLDENGGGLWSFYRYHAIRNPANGLRSIEWLDLDIYMPLVRFRTGKYVLFYEPWYLRRFGVDKTVWYLAWQGWKAGFKFVHIWNDNRHFVFKFGWRIEPRDAYYPLDEDGQRVHGAGFATKLLPYREG